MAIDLTCPQPVRTIICILLILYGVSGLFQPVCHIDNDNPRVGDVVTLTCRPAINDSSENITLTWFHDGVNISVDQQSGRVRAKLSEADIGITFTCREALSMDNEEQHCSITPLLRLTTPDTNSSDTHMLTTATPEDKRESTIKILFIAIVVAGALPIIVAIIACIVWIARKTKGESQSYELERPRSDSFDDFDPDTVVDGRPAAPLPSEMQTMSSSAGSIRNGGPPPVLKSLVEKESFYSNTPPVESLYQNTAMGHSTLPAAAPTKNNIYLVPKCSPSASQDDLIDENAKIYENTPSMSPGPGYVNKQQRFESDHTSSLPNFRY